MIYKGGNKTTSGDDPAVKIAPGPRAIKKRDVVARRGNCRPPPRGRRARPAACGPAPGRSREAEHVRDKNDERRPKDRQRTRHKYGRNKYRAGEGGAGAGAAAYKSRFITINKSKGP
ncbi:hypothetical protein EVAR_55372_1 [Eumeta japonica]|uniref:Uncharacterized protein n=1 Tax=Eumeta variegata TaxID=151549 RepID=A0A4C1YWV9_EUMVA|nr:hypothetical protein EVAR_55372_1 [Eumeta japonica]